MPIRLALIGAGSISSHHARVIAESTHARLDVVIDSDADKAQKLADQFGCSFSKLLDPAFKCDAAIVATSTDSHTEIGLTLLEAGRPLLVEKPLASSVDDVDLLIKQSEAKDVPLMCGFVERFNPVVGAAGAWIETSPLHLVALRHSPHTPRATASVVNDLLIHDIDLALRFFSGAKVTRAYGMCSAPAGSLVEIADCSIEFENGAVATLSSSRTSHRKIRQIYIDTQDALVEMDLLRTTLTIYRHVRHEQVAATSTTYRAETVVDIPFVRHAGEPLALQLDYFLKLCDGRADADSERRGLLAPHRIAANIEGS